MLGASSQSTEGIVEISFDPSTRHLQRILQCLERTGKSIIMTFGPTTLTISQQPAASATQYLPTWTHLPYSSLGLHPTLPVSLLSFELPISPLLSILSTAISTHPFAKLAIQPTTLCIISGRTTDLRVGVPGVLVHELPIVMMQDEPREPTIPRPAISFILPAGLKRFGNMGDAMTVGVNERGALICEVKTALMDTSMKGSVRVLPGSPADDPLRLIRMTIGVKHLMRALTVTSHIPGVTLRCAMIPDHVMVISAVLTDEGGSITFFIPPLDRL